jgi:hypothetical protein
MDELHKYLKRLGMNISVQKSQIFQVVAKKDTWFIKDSAIKVDNVRIPGINPDQAFKYLSAKVRPWKGVHCSIIVPESLGVVRRVRKLPLKPCQLAQINCQVHLSPIRLPPSRESAKRLRP